MALRVLTWNLMHGRAVPPAGHELFDEFAAALHSWEWDVALLQEVPPWWPGRLGYAHRLVLTSRNALLPLRRAIAIRWPDVIKSHGGGCNAILVRPPATIVTHRVQRLRTVRERRWLHGVQLHSGVWVGNLHAGATVREARLAADTMRDWASGAPAVLGGDFNLHAVALAGFAWAAGHEPDHILVTGGLWPEPGSAAVLDHGTLSDHAPVAVTLTPGA